MEADEAVQLGFQDALLVAVGAEALGTVLDVGSGTDAVALDALGAQERHVAGAGAHRRQGGGGVVLRHRGFQYLVGLGVQARAAAGPHAAFRRRPAVEHHLDRRVVHHLLHLLEEALRILVGREAHVQRGAGFRRDHVVAVAALDHVGRDRRPQHRRVPRFVLEQPGVGGPGDLRIQAEHVAVVLRHVRRRQRGEALEVGGRGVVERDRRPPRGHARDSARQVRDGVGGQRHRAVAGDAARDQVDAARDLLHRLDGGEAHLVGLARDVTALGVAVLRVDGGEVLVRHQLDADACRALLTRLRQEDHVAVQRQVGALEQQHHHQRRREVVLVVHRAAAVDVAAIPHGAERRMRPLLRVHIHDVGVAHDQQRPLAAVALDARDDVRPVGLARVDLDRQAFALQHALQVVGGGFLVAGRVAGVELDQRLEVAQRLGLNRFPVGIGRRLGVRRGDECRGREECKGRGAHAAIVAELKLFPRPRVRQWDRRSISNTAPVARGRGQLFRVCSVKASKSSHSPVTIFGGQRYL